MAGEVVCFPKMTGNDPESLSFHRPKTNDVIRLKATDKSYDLERMQHEGIGTTLN